MKILFTSLVMLLCGIAMAFSQPTIVGFGADSQELPAVVDSIYNSMTTRQRVGQMIFLAAGEHGRKNEELHKLIRADALGGIIFLGGTADEFRKMKVGYDSLTQVKLLYSLDAEPSLMKYKLRNIKTFARTNTLKDSSAIDSVASIIDSHLIDLGIHINYAPVCDLTPLNEVIGHRSFGKNVDSVAMLSKVFIDRSIADNILPVIKHFPGHGNVEGDSHKKLVFIDGEFKELEVFRKMIDMGVPGVMVGHIAIRNNPYASEMPATCSRLAVTDLLRDSLGFDGLVFTDALNMGAVSSIDNAGFLAMEAGCDVILMPLDPEMVIDSALKKIKEDDEFALQIETSVKRILLFKYSLGLLN